ncbi:MAG: hypothetical protein K0R93_3454 [Anaerosolibacter sp.]|jgi:hypothetical protein|uniref:DUF4367 domain-containing protein n=1 Tax=Anaerosolibacter sp. TaxID=1872527 RepID=UPI002630399D|nr:DUF4367 domain-containing protein [Anaerosolibacter sp.]MDF2548556.1 hypothetical protein [Anaerosolibacter sp.]
MDRNKDVLDKVIEDAISNELDEIEITDDEIEAEWLKLKNMTPQTISKPKSRKYNKAIAVAATTFLAIGVFSFLILNATTASKTNKSQSAVTETEERKSIERESSIEEMPKDGQENSNEMSVSIENARDIVNFDFKELPYTLEGTLVTTLPNSFFIIELNYTWDDQKIRLTQFLEGFEFKQNIGIPNESTVEKIDKNGVEYTYINIGNKKTKVIWSSMGINYTLDLKSNATKEETMEIIEAMK